MVKLIVKDMMCAHCKKTIEDVLYDNDIEATINLEEKSVLVSDSDKEKAVFLIREEGFNVA